jgi:hypothetical protein
MATRKSPKNNHNNLEEAMALLIRNQAAFVEQIARTDQERLELKRKSEEFEREAREQFSRIDGRFTRVEERLGRIETILVQLPEAIRQKIGFKAQK